MFPSIADAHRSEWIESSDALASNLANNCWKMLSGRVGHGLERDDVLQEARIGLVQAANDFDPACGTAFSTWASYKVRGALCAMLRKIGHLPEARQFDLDNQDADEIAAPAADNDTAIDVRAALAELSPNQRALIEAVHFEGRTHAELAALRGCSTKTIQRHLADAESALKELFSS